MTRILACLLLAVAAGRAGAQRWQSGRDIELIRRAVDQRAARDADTLLSGWQAMAHGVLRYASVIDHGDGPVERVIRADEVLAEVYGEPPNRSKQTIVAWRDTSFLPNHLTYHRDHLGIVANDFGPVIRLGQGDEVRDVPHPLSQAGLDRYQFALGDTAILAGPRGKVRVITIAVRPAQVDSEAAVGTLYLDIERAALVRFQFTFTPASYRDRTVRDITVTLENALQEGLRWLPWRQSIVIRREMPWLELPLETVIRADWTIDNYQLGVRHPAERFAGPAIAGLVVPSHGDTTAGGIATDLGALPATSADVDAVARDAARTLGGHELDGMPRIRLTGGGISDFVRANRAEGVVVALGGRARLAGQVTVSGRIGAGLSDHRLIGLVGVAGPLSSLRWSIAAERTVRDIADEPVLSGLANTIGTILSGADFGDYVLVQRATATVSAHPAHWQVSLSLGRERHRSVFTSFAPISGQPAANPSLGDDDAWVINGRVGKHDRAGDGWSIDAEVGSGRFTWVRLHGTARTRIALSAGELQLRAEAGIAGDSLPEYRDFVLGGRGTLPGIPFRSLGGRRDALVEVAWATRIGVPSPPFPYARFVQLRSTIAPYLAVGSAGGDVPRAPWRATGRVEPVAGIRLDLWGPLLRIDAGVSLRTGTVAFTIDAHPDWWSLM